MDLQYIQGNDLIFCVINVIGLGTREARWFPLFRAGGSNVSYLFSLFRAQ